MTKILIELDKDKYNSMVSIGVFDNVKHTIKYLENESELKNDYIYESLVLDTNNAYKKQIEYYKNKVKWNKQK